MTNNEFEYKRERWVYARPMYRIGNTQYSKEWFKMLRGSLIGEVSVWDFNKPNPLIRDSSNTPIGKIKVIG